MNIPNYAIKIPGDSKISGHMKYVKNDSGEVAVFESRVKAMLFLIDMGIGEEKIQYAEFIESIGTCNKCGSPLFSSDLPDYESQCFVCDEDFYSIEQEVDIK